jgi:hypothetical protein
VIDFPERYLLIEVEDQSELKLADRNPSLTKEDVAVQLVVSVPRCAVLRTPRCSWYGATRRSAGAGSLAESGKGLLGCGAVT